MNIDIKKLCEIYFEINHQLNEKVRCDIQGTARGKIRPYENLCNFIPQISSCLIDIENLSEEEL